MLSLIGKDSLLARMLLVRVVEDILQELCLEGLAGDLHFSKGQEAISVGVCAALRDSDYIVTHHRSIAHAIASGVPVEEVLREVLQGVAGEMHMSFPAQRFMFCWQLVGTCVPVAAGIAWAAKNYLKTDDIVVCFHGDAATANGQWHEGVNIAAVNRLPLLLVCENNHLAGNVRPENYQPCGIETWQRMYGYGLAGIKVDGNDVEAVCKAAEIAIEAVRRHQMPFMLECDTTRLGRHKQGQGDLRSPEEMAELGQRDPLKNADPQALAALKEEVRSIIKRLDRQT